jgi:30S ribosomal protein 3
MTTTPAKKYSLKVYWSEESLLLGVDRLYNASRSPITDYFNWPKENAWESLKVQLEKKEWIDQQERYSLLQQATDVINFWQQKKENPSVDKAREKFPEILFVT